MVRLIILCEPSSDLRVTEVKLPVECPLLRIHPVHDPADQRARANSKGGCAVKEVLDDGDDDVVIFHRRHVHIAIDDGDDDCGDDADDNRANDLAPDLIIRRR